MASLETTNKTVIALLIKIIFKKLKTNKIKQNKTNK